MQKIFVEQLPVIKASETMRNTISEIVLFRLFLSDQHKLQSAYFEQVIDALVYELYFPEEIKTAGKEILHHLGKLKSITGIMTDAEKLPIIQSEFDRLYDPIHPVRNNIETLDSVEEVRIIREALKR